MSNYTWPSHFSTVFEATRSWYRTTTTRSGNPIPAVDLPFLASIGCSEQELMDLVEDHAQGGDPSYETTLLITAVRRDYFLTIQKGQQSTKNIDMNLLPAKTAVLAGFAWLPRIIQKAEAKLRGEMPKELMYCCGGDRAFLRSVNIHPADFLRQIWSARGDQEKIINYVKTQAGKA